MKILITGGTGFIGRTLCHRLLDLEHTGGPGQVGPHRYSGNSDPGGAVARHLQAGFNRPDIRRYRLHSLGGARRGLSRHSNRLVSQGDSIPGTVDAPFLAGNHADHFVRRCLGDSTAGGQAGPDLIPSSWLHVGMGGNGRYGPPGAFQHAGCVGQ